MANAQPLSRARMPASFWFGVAVVGLFGVAALAMALHFIIYLDYAVAAVRYPFQLDYGEGIVWQQALLIPGSHMYDDITKYPFIVFHYPPMFHLVTRAVAMVTHDFLIAGRLTSLVSTLVVGMAAAALVTQAVGRDVGWTAKGIGAAIAGLSIFCYPPVMQWAPLMRVDPLAIALSFLAILATMRRPLRLGSACLGMALFVAAIYTKQVSVAAPVATVAVLGLIDRRIAFRACVFGFVLALVLLLVMMWLTDGRFLLHILRYNINPFNWRGPYWHVEPQWPQFGVLALAIACVLRYWTLVRGSIAHGLDAIASRVAQYPIPAVFACYLATSTGMLATLGKSGSSSNYLIQWMCVWSVLAGILVATEIDRVLSPAGGIMTFHPMKAILRLVAPVLLLVEVGIAQTPSMADEMSPQQLARQTELVDRIRAATRPVLSDDMVLLLKAGKPVPWEPAIFADLAKMGGWDQNLIIDMIRARRFAFIITVQRDSTMYKALYNPPVDAAIDAAYPDAESVGRYLIRSPPEPAN